MKLSIFIFFSFICGSLFADTYEIQLARRINIKNDPNHITKFESCHLLKCEPIGNIEGYTEENLRKIRVVARAKGEVFGRIVDEALKNSGEFAFAMFARPALTKQKKYMSVLGPVDSLYLGVYSKAEEDKTADRDDSFVCHADFAFKDREYREKFTFFDEKSPFFNDAVKGLRELLGAK